MRGVFVDANEALAVIFERLTKPGDPAVRIHRDPDVTTDQLPKILDGAEIAVFEDRATSHAVVICALDNLGKGAAGQALQNANLALGLEQTLGLRLAGVLV